MRRSLIFLLLKLLPLVSVSGYVQAENDDETALLQLYGDEEMISIATGSSQPIAKAPAVATIITAEDIKTIGATDIDDVLATVPGLHVTRSNTGYNPIYTIRGVYSGLNPQVLLLINGIPITNLFAGDRSQVWGGMPVEAISRIEVIRGPGSAIYGADSFAATINIITKKAREIDGTEAGLRIGSFDTQDAWFLHGDEWGGFDVAFMLELHDTEGHKERIDADLQTALDGIFGTNASLAPGDVNLSRQNLDARLDVSRGYWQFRAGLQRRRDWGTGAGVAQTLDPEGEFASDRWNADLTYHNPDIATNWDITAQISYLDTSQEVEQDIVLFPPGTNQGFGELANGLIGNPEVFERHYRINLSAFYTGFERHQVRIGAGYNFSDLYDTKESKNFGFDPETGEPLPPNSPVVDVSDTPFVFLHEGDRDNTYFFAQDVWRVAPDWELTAGVRYDNYSDFGDTINPRLALVWDARHNLITKLLYGRAFRAPSFAETRNINNPIALGNPDLNPETLESLELAFDYRPNSAWRIGLNMFAYRWDDIIRFVPDVDATTSTAQNAGQQDGYGLEFEIDWSPTDTVRLVGNYAFQRSTDEDSNSDAGNSPHHQFYLRGEWEFKPDWDLSAQWNWIVDRKRVAGDERPNIDDYSTVDVTLRRKNIKDQWEFALSARNLFDADAREPSPFSTPIPIPNDLPLAGRRVFGELRYRF